MSAQSRYLCPDCDKRFDSVQDAARCHNSPVVDLGEPRSTEATEDRNVPPRSAFDYVKHAGWVATGLRDQVLSLGMNQRIYAERALHAIAAQADEIERLTATLVRIETLAVNDKSGCDVCVRVVAECLVANPNG